MNALGGERIKCFVIFSRYSVVPMPHFRRWQYLAPCQQVGDRAVLSISRKIATAAMAVPTARRSAAADSAVPSTVVNKDISFIELLNRRPSDVRYHGLCSACFTCVAHSYDTGIPISSTADRRSIPQSSDRRRICRS